MLKKLGMRALAQREVYRRHLEPFCFSIRDLGRNRPGLARAVAALSSPRARRLEYRYFAGDSINKNPAEEQPIVELSKGIYFLSQFNMLMHAIHGRGLRAITADANTTMRDRYLEEKVDKLFSELFPNARRYRSYELPGGEGENDLIIVAGRPHMRDQ
jgi:hypothetical protein